jgi:uncharacterized membrane protein YkgB
MMRAVARTRSIASDLADLDRLTTHALRWTLVLIFIWFGGMKFTEHEAEGITPFTSASPFFDWLHMWRGARESSAVIGILELTVCLALAVGTISPGISVIGSLMSMTTFTLTFMFTTHGVTELTAGGFPALSAIPGQFLLEDAVLLAASFTLLVRSLQAVAREAAQDGRSRSDLMGAPQSRVG